MLTMVGKRCILPSCPHSPLCSTDIRITILFLTLYICGATYQVVR